MVDKFLIKKGYKQYSTPIKPHSNCYQKRVASKRVCDLNEKLFINIDHTKLFINGKRHESFEVYICAEHKSLWWNLKVYSITEYYLIKNIDKLESALIKLFNSISL